MAVADTIRAILEELKQTPDDEASIVEDDEVDEPLMDRIGVMRDIRGIERSSQYAERLNWGD